jgi:hypothetical protein
MRLAMPVPPKAFPQIMLKKWTGLGTVPNSVLENRRPFIRKILPLPMEIPTTNSLKRRRSFENLQP